MRMKNGRSIAQLRAISYAYAEKRRDEAHEELAERGLTAIYNHQSIYKTMRGFLHASPERLSECARQAFEVVRHRLAIYAAQGYTGARWQEFTAVEIKKSGLIG